MRHALALLALASLAPGCGQATTLDGDGGAGTGDASHEPCTIPGTIETQPCGTCGTIDRFCSSEHVWAYGVCSGEGGECTPGTMTTRACGHCGTGPAFCDTTCHWVDEGACAGEGPCAPGTRTRTSDGCSAGQTRDSLCDARCQPQPMGICTVDGCTSPGVIEQMPCGMCGTMSRQCDSSFVWQYGTCTDEGVCMPGSASVSPCGMCGSGRATCDASCQWALDAGCAGEGVCTAGATTSTSTGCVSGEHRVLACAADCSGYTIEVSPCAVSRPVDVMFLLDVTGSTSGALTAAIPSLEDNCMQPLLALSDVDVGVSYMGEVPVEPYGEADCRPFIRGLAPGASLVELRTEIAARPTMVGEDGEDGGLLALSMLSGGAMEEAATPFTCAAGREAGGCWRPGSARVIVAFTDSPMHGAPRADGTLDLPYMNVTPEPATWATVRTQLLAERIVVVWLDASLAAGGDSSIEMSAILAGLGQPATDRHVTTNAAQIATACSQITDQVRTLAGP